jgi:tetratricopeptide (TPR) repeat protein
MLVSLLTLVLAFAQAPVQTPDANAELAAARQLYANASYEEALERLGRVNPPPALADQVDTYRALCLLALGRSRESEQIIERVLTRNPKFTLDEADVSPRLVMVFRAVRARLLPVTARNLYALARASFEAKQYDTAARQFREVVDLLSAEPHPDASVADLRMLAEGFLRQVNALGSTTDTAMREGAGDVSTTGIIYSILDRDVIAPVEISRPVPIMDSPPGGKPGTYQGLVEIVIGETGRVVQVAIRKSIHPSFDADVIASTGYWRFQPATKNGKPVKFRRAYEIIGHSR